MGHQLTKSDSKRGGTATKITTAERRADVEKYMTAGFSATQILAVRKNKRSIGTPATIKKDMNEIRSRWLDMDTGWFNRARIARIEASTRFKAQIVRLNLAILEIQKSDDPDRLKKLTYAESQLTTVISRLYEVESDMDPEQELDKKMLEGMKNKNYITPQAGT